MDKHTSGKLCVSPGGNLITDAQGESVMIPAPRATRDEQIANAHRVVALWNATQGIDTETLLRLPDETTLTGDALDVQLLRCGGCKSLLPINVRFGRDGAAVSYLTDQCGCQKQRGVIQC